MPAKQVLQTLLVSGVLPGFAARPPPYQSTLQLHSAEPEGDRKLRQHLAERPVHSRRTQCLGARLPPALRKMQGPALKAALAASTELWQLWTSGFGKSFGLLHLGLPHSHHVVARVEPQRLLDPLRQHHQDFLQWALHLLRAPSARMGRPRLLLQQGLISQQTPGIIPASWQKSSSTAIH